MGEKTVKGIQATMHICGPQRKFHGEAEIKVPSRASQVKDSLGGQAEKSRPDAQGILKKRNDRRETF